MLPLFSSHSHILFHIKPRFLIKYEPPCVSFEMKKLLWSLTLFGVILSLRVNGEFDKMEKFTDFNGTNVYQTENHDVNSKAKATMVGLTLIKNAALRSAGNNIFSNTN